MLSLSTEQNLVNAANAPSDPCCIKAQSMIETTGRITTYVLTAPILAACTLVGSGLNCIESLANVICCEEPTNDLSSKIRSTLNLNTKFYVYMQPCACSSPTNNPEKIPLHYPLDRLLRIDQRN